MRASRKSASKDGSGRRYILLRLLLILIVVLLGLYVLPTPWAFHMGGRFSPVGEWDGYGAIQAGNGGHYLLYTHLRGDLANNHGHAGCSFVGCNVLSGTAQLCTQGGQHYTFDLTGAVLPIADTDNSFSEVFTPSGAIRTTRSTAAAAAARGTLRYGSVTSFDSACRTLAGQAP